MTVTRALDVLHPKSKRERDAERWATLPVRLGVVRNPEVHTIIVSLHAEVRWLDRYPNCRNVEEEITWAIREQPHVSPGVVQALAARKKADDGSTYIATPDRAGIIVGVKSGPRFTVVTVLRLGIPQIKWMLEHYPIEAEDIEEPAPPKPDDLVEPHLKRSKGVVVRLPGKAVNDTAGLAMFRRILNAKPHLIHEARRGCPYASALLKHLDDMITDIGSDTTTARPAEKGQE
jgi:hypothetical protein